MDEAVYRDEAIRRARRSGYLPARLQRAVDWTIVRVWEARASLPDFAWHAAGDAIIIGPASGSMRAIHAGQHRILGGLMAVRPVPNNCMTWIVVPDPGRSWESAAAQEIDLGALLGLR
jgi:hypothetical protein